MTTSLDIVDCGRYLSDCPMPDFFATMPTAEQRDIMLAAIDGCYSASMKDKKLTRMSVGREMVGAIPWLLLIKVIAFVLPYIIDWFKNRHEYA